MKLAISKAYLGISVEAKEVMPNYDAYLDLICPECGNAVFLNAGRKASTRKHPKTGKIIQVAEVQPYFSHFKGDDPCFLKVQQILKSDRLIISGKDRGQRLKKVHSQYLEIIYLTAFTDPTGRPVEYSKSNLNAAKKQAEKLFTKKDVEKTLLAWQKHFKHNFLTTVFDFIDSGDYKTHPRNSWNHPANKTKEGRELIAIADKAIATINKKPSTKNYDWLLPSIQKKILAHLHEFFTLKTNKKLLEKLSVVALEHFLGMITNPHYRYLASKIAGTSNALLAFEVDTIMFNIIAQINWAKEFRDRVQF